MEDLEQTEIEDEDELKYEKRDLLLLMGLIIVGILMILFARSLMGLMWNETDDAMPTLEVTDWDIDAHPRKFLMMDDNGSWSYEYEFNFDVWIYSESNGGGYPNTWIGINYVVNNKTVESKFIYITESGGSASHHQKRLITNYRVTEDDDVKIILEFPQSGFEWVDDANDFTRYSWLIVYDVDVGTEGEIHEE